VAAQRPVSPVCNLREMPTYEGGAVASGQQRSFGDGEYGLSGDAECEGKGAR
jgi:hypothetical protein